MKSRINDVGKVLGGMKVFSCTAMGMNIKRRLYEGVAAPTVLYGAERMDYGSSREEVEYNGDEVSEEYVWNNAYRLSNK